MIKRILNRMTLTEERPMENFRQHGGMIGKGCKIYAPGSVTLDMGKAFLIEIGDYCKITEGVTILAHDYSRSVVRMKYGENVGGSAPVSIGNNCFIGMNATILMGTKIGNNCIIGAGSVVKGAYPNEVVIAGNPAKIVCTLEEFYKKRKARCLDEAVTCVKQIYKNTGKLPTVKQLGDGFAWLYLPRTEKTIRDYPAYFCLSGDVSEWIVRDFMNTPGMFESFDAFLDYACEKAEIPKK